MDNALIDGTGTLTTNSTFIHTDELPGSVSPLSLTQSLAESLVTSNLHEGFEDGLDAVNTGGFNGTVRIEYDTFGSTPTEGTQQVLLATTNTWLSTATMEIVGIEIGADEILSFDANLLVNDGSLFGGATVNVLAGGTVVETFDLDSLVASFSNSATPYTSESGYQTYSTSILPAGTYTLEVIVFDLFFGGNTGLLFDNVRCVSANEFDVGTVTDTNDGVNTVEENATNGTTVGITAFATDNDLTNNAITYTLQDSAGGRFTIDGTSGVVTVANGTLLDYEADQSHNITVRATSEDGSFTDQVFTIAVTDADEFDVGTVTDTNDGVNTVEENATNGTTVGITAFATDNDLTNNAITYTLQDSAGGRFTIDGTSGVVTVANGTLLDYEADQSHNITVRATSEDGSFTDQVFTIAVTDADEFDVGTVTDTNDGVNTVEENATNGTTVGITAFATDNDLTNNAITYTLQDSAGGRFTIDGTSGVVTVANGTLLDYEADQSHNITVRATSEDGSFTDQVFTIAVTDADEFDVGTVTDTNDGVNTVEENAANGTTVGITAFATDDDLTNNAITYTLQDSAGGRFTIDGTSGVVTVANGTLLDYETAPVAQHHGTRHLRGWQLHRPGLHHRGHRCG